MFEEGGAPDAEQKQEGRDGAGRPGAPRDKVIAEPAHYEPLMAGGGTTCAAPIAMGMYHPYLPYPPVVNNRGQLPYGVGHDFDSTVCVARGRASQPDRSYRKPGRGDNCA